MSTPMFPNRMTRDDAGVLANLLPEYFVVEAELVAEHTADSVKEGQREDPCRYQIEEYDEVYDPCNLGILNVDVEGCQ